MAYRCTAHNLHSFVQILAGLDVRLFRSGSRRYNFDHLNSITGHRLRPRSSSQLFLSRLNFSTQRQTIKKGRHPEIDIHNQSVSDTENVSHGDINDAVVEILPDQIDRLAAELLSSQERKKTFSEENAADIMKESFQEETLEKTPLMDLRQHMPKKKAPQSNIEPNSIFNDRALNKNLSRSNSSRSNLSRGEKPKVSHKEPWRIEKERIKEKYPNGYRPLKKLSPDAMDGIRALHGQMPDVYTTARLAEEFKISPEAIRRILKSKWRPNTDEAQERDVRWFRRGEQIWSRWAELGATPPKKFRRIGIGEKPPRHQYTPDPLPELITSSIRGNSRNPDSSSSGSENGGIL